MDSVPVIEVELSAIGRVFVFVVLIIMTVGSSFIAVTWLG
jgi:hypothetical protein